MLRQKCERFKLVKKKEEAHRMYSRSMAAKSGMFADQGLLLLDATYTVPMEQEK
jgi:hypothetical protein